jgi:glycosyltransferase involved in cell wall biosynthesis
MISVLILTKNEAQDLPGCLQSVRWSDDVCVFDSGSTDSTATIAKQAGARFVQRAGSSEKAFGGDEAAHKNWALANIPFQHKWVFHLDADERVPPELAKSMREAVANPGDNVAFRVRRRDFWEDTWLKHAVASSFYIRLFRRDKMRYERLINPVSIADGPVGEVAGYLDHYPFSKGMTHWLSKHNAYSSLEAEQIVRNRAARREFSFSQAFLAKDFNQRRFHQKELFYRIPARPLLKFFLLYVVRRGFLDGRAGLNYALLQSFYESIIVFKTRELTGKSAASGGTLQVPRSVSTQAGVSDVNLEGFHANTSSID